MNQPALASDTDGLSNKTGPDAERRGNGVRFSEIGISHILNFYPDLACLFQDGKIAHLNHSGAMLLGLIPTAVIIDLCAPSPSIRWT